MPDGVLLAILANPPTCGGQRTLARLDLAKRLMGFGDVRVVNLFAVASRSTREMGRLGACPDGWLDARTPIENALGEANAVLLAFGLEPPNGRARSHFREQVLWLQERIEERHLVTWQIGDGPRHPSRWQRWTHRAHPDLGFEQAIARSLSLARVSSPGLHPSGLATSAPPWVCGHEQETAV